ncbi:MAG: hypothetical protein CMJ50_08975 [Planctomycetaceae bacterium]|nr:hypothetical protein [Planctomycetaceae bacterium]
MPPNILQWSTQIRLVELLKDRRRLAGSYEHLEAEILQANDDKANLRIGRRKLARITGGKPVSLSFGELQGLDNYLRQHGHSLAAIFDRPTVIKSLVESGRVTFMLGAQPGQRTTTISRWDLRSATALLRSVDQAAIGIHIDLEDVLRLHPEYGSLDSQTYQRRFSQEGWYKLLIADEGPSLVFIGSPRSCHAAEIALAEMFEVRAFDKTVLTSPRRAPFLFVWSRRRYQQLTSSFALDGSKLEGYSRLRQS